MKNEKLKMKKAKTRPVRGEILVEKSTIKNSVRPVGTAGG